MLPNMLFFAALLSIGCASSRPSAFEKDHIDIDHPMLDLSMEELEKMYEEYPPKLSWSPKADDFGSDSTNQGQDSSSMYSEVFDMAYLDKAYRDVDEQSIYRLKGLESGSSDVGMTRTEPSMSKSDRSEARNNFFYLAEKLGSDLKKETLLKRFRAFVTPTLIKDLIAGDKDRRYRATASILLHRSTRMRKFQSDQLPPLWQQVGEEMPFYHGLTKEAILEHIYSIMDVAPAEDMELWWYDQIYKFIHHPQFSDLFSRDRVKQEAVISNMANLEKRGRLWVRKIQSNAN